jgi:hypothetical protein
MACLEGDKKAATLCCRHATDATFCPEGGQIRLNSGPRIDPDALSTVTRILGVSLIAHISTH